MFPTHGLTPPPFPVDVGVVSTKPWKPQNERLVRGVQDVKLGQLVMVP